MTKVTWTPACPRWSYNQLRQKIGVVYGNPETTTGGNALKFHASVRLDIRKTGVVKNGEHAVFLLKVDAPREIHGAQDAIRGQS